LRARIERTIRTHRSGGEGHDQEVVKLGCKGGKGEKRKVGKDKRQKRRKGKQKGRKGKGRERKRKGRQTQKS